MAMSRTLLILLTVFTVAAPGQQRSDKEIKNKERELQKLRSDIQSYEAKIRRSEVREKSTLDVLDDLESQSDLIRKLVGSLKDEESDITDEIERIKNSITDLEQQLQHLRSHYAGYVKSIYKHGRVYDLELLFSSRSVNQLYIRTEYLKKFADQRVRDLTEIQQKKAALEDENERLMHSLDNQHQLLAEKSREERNLKEKLTDKKSLLRSIRKNKVVYRNALARKNAAADQVEQLIADLIEKEDKRKQEEAEVERKRLLADARAREDASSISSTPVSPDTRNPALAFDQLKGRLRWPVLNGVVTKDGRFGKHIHPDLKTVTQNTGVDIQTRAGSNVFAVADGEVAALSFIPGFGNILIINNYSGFHTVYAHLSEINVSKSDRVSEGEVIAHSGESVDGSLLHFEIWKERNKLDPEQWLTRRQ